MPCHNGSPDDMPCHLRSRYGSLGASRTRPPGARRDGAVPRPRLRPGYRPRDHRPCRAHHPHLPPPLRRQFPNAVMVPVHASWLNQVEIYFSVVQRKVVSPNDFTDLNIVVKRLADFEAPLQPGRETVQMEVHHHRPHRPTPTPGTAPGRYSKPRPTPSGLNP